VHGANRLASNSLLDGLVFGRRVVEAIAGGKTRANSTGAMAGALDAVADAEPAPDPVVLPNERSADADDVDVAAEHVISAVQRTMSADCGVVREADGLDHATEALSDLAGRGESLPARRVRTYETLNVLRVSRAIVAAASAREESRGSHTRRDFPTASDAARGRFVVSGAEPPVFVPLARVAAGERA
jgi:L-aspartate oxidase